MTAKNAVVRHRSGNVEGSVRSLHFHRGPSWLLALGAGTTTTSPAWSAPLPSTTFDFGLCSCGGLLFYQSAKQHTALAFYDWTLSWTITFSAVGRLVGDFLSSFCKLCVLIHHAKTSVATLAKSQEHSQSVYRSLAPVSVGALSWSLLVIRCSSEVSLSL